MSGRVAARLESLGIALAAVPPPVANYIPVVISGNLAFVSGQLPTKSGQLKDYTGCVGRDVDARRARDAARQAAINVLAVLNDALDGDLDRVLRVVKVTGIVNAVPGFLEHPEVVNGASDLFVEVFGESGRHSRAAFGAGSLPRNAIVEIEAVFEIS